MQEGIKWTPIEYFNNKVVCDLIESKLVRSDHHHLNISHVTSAFLLEALSLSSRT